jgi:hypothetical protein
MCETVPRLSYTRPEREYRLPAEKLPGTIHYSRCQLLAIEDPRVPLLDNPRERLAQFPELYTDGIADAQNLGTPSDFYFLRGKK